MNEIIDVVIKQGIREKRLAVQAGTNLMDLLIEKQFLIIGACGKRGICNSCLVQINGKWEKACQYHIQSEATIELNNIDVENKYQVKKIPSNHKYGIAVDIGTTTIALFFVDKSKKEVVREVTLLNKQQAYGSDVMTRIVASKTNLKTLQQLVIESINDEINNFKQQYKVGLEDMVVVGNTTMLYLLNGIDPSALGEAPYMASFLEYKQLRGQELGIDINQIALLPGKSAFIGADIISGISVVIKQMKSKTSLFLDLGTNGEMILHHQGKWIACSSAAGPALEGATISCGIGGVKGAIDHILNDDWQYQTIGSTTPIGICGSGLIDAIALLRKQERIDEYGMFKENTKKPFSITPNITITQNDIHQFQYAKSAIFSAIHVLLNQAKIKPEQVEVVYLAGGLGTYISIINAIGVGLFPPEWENKIQPIGNASGYGAVLFLLNRFWINFNLIIKQIEVIDLASNQLFNHLFLEELVIK